MKCGKYRVIEDIHVYICALGQLKVPKGKIIEVKEDGTAYVDGERISIRFLEVSRSHLLKML